LPSPPARENIAQDLSIPTKPALQPAAISTNPAEVEKQLALQGGRISEVRVALASLGFDPGSPDVGVGPRFRRALRDFQKVHRVEESGYLDLPTLQRLEETLAQAPKSYDGLWSLEIHRYNYLDSDPNELNTRTHLASAKLRVRNGEFFVVSSEMLSTNRNEFETFQGRIDPDGRVSMSMRLTYLFGKSKAARLAITHTLPKLVPLDRSFEVKGNQVEREIWYKIKLQRVAS
jgi:hypothetical protein